MKGRKQDGYLGIHLLPRQQNTQSQLSHKKGLLIILSYCQNTGLALINSSTEAGLRAHAKLGGCQQFFFPFYQVLK